MNIVYLLKHKRLVEIKNDEMIYSTKTIGYLSSRDIAEKTILEYRQLIGFIDYPNDFYIEELTIDKDYYEEGRKLL